MPGAAMATIASIMALLAAVTPSQAATTPSDAVTTTTSAGTGSTLATTTGCGRAPTLKSGTNSIQSSGKSRTYILKIPDNYDSSRPYRLVFGLHWLGGTASDVASGRMVQPFYGLQRLSNNSTIFVAPQGLGEGKNTGWPNTGGEDLTLVDNMIKELESALCIDTTQLFALGFSYGGGMSYAIACARAKVFRAVAVYSGSMFSGCSGGTDPIAYLQVHGISDTLAIDRARTMRDRFVKNNGCTAQNPPDPKQGSRTHVKAIYAGCSAGHPVAWYAFDGGHTPVPTDSGGSPWLPAETWKFFTQFEDTSKAPTR